MYSQGCSRRLEQVTKESLILIGGIALGFCFIQIFGIIFSCCLIRKIKEAKYRYWQRGRVKLRVQFRPRSAFNNWWMLEVNYNLANLFTRICYLIHVHTADCLPGLQIISYSTYSVSQCRNRNKWLNTDNCLSGTVVIKKLHQRAVQNYSSSQK